MNQPVHSRAENDSIGRGFYTRNFEKPRHRCRWIFPRKKCPDEKYLLPADFTSQFSSTFFTFSSLFFFFLHLETMTNYHSPYLSLSLSENLSFRARTESRPRWEICEEGEKRKRVAAEGILERKQKLGRRESAGPIVVGRWLAWVRLKRIGGEYNGALRIYNISGIRLAGDPFAMWNLWKCGGWEKGKPAKSGEGRSVE